MPIAAISNIYRASKVSADNTKRPILAGLSKTYNRMVAAKIPKMRAGLSI